MGKLLLTLSTLSLILLGAGTAIAPNDALFWLASSAGLYQIVRLVSVMFLIAQIFTQPPRRHWFRVVTGVMAMGIAGWTLHGTMNYTMPAMDTFSFLGASVTLMVTALEARYVPAVKYQSLGA